MATLATATGDRNRERPSWLERALQRNQLQSQSDVFPLPLSSTTTGNHNIATGSPTRSRHVIHNASTAQSSTRAANPTPFAGAHTNKVPPLTGTAAQPDILNRKLAYLRESPLDAANGSPPIHSTMVRSHTIHLGKPPRHPLLSPDKTVKRSSTIQIPRRNRRLSPVERTDDKMAVGSPHSSHGNADAHSLDTALDNHRRILAAMVPQHEDSTLPPIHFARERTLYLENFDAERKRDLAPWGSQNNLNGVVDKHWRMKPRPVRPDVEDKIVTHLKKQFVQRLEKRYHTMVYDQETDFREAFRRDHQDNKSDHMKHDKNMPGHWRNLADESPVTSGDSRQGPRSMSRPVTRDDSKKPADKLSLSLARPRGASNVGLQNLSYAQDYEIPQEGESRTRTPSEQNAGEEGTGNQQANGRKVFDLTGLATREQTTFEPSPDSDPDDASLDPATLERMLQGEEEEGEGNYPDLPVSPVPTPFIFSRPKTTRSMRGVSAQERRRLAVEEGVVHLRIPSQAKTLALYLHSAGKDTEVERSALMSHTWPALKTYCRTRGYDLEVVDLEWGCGDLVLDDHGHVTMAPKLIDQCHQRGKGVTFMTMLAQKQNEAQVPTEIDQSEFDAILHEMHEEKHRLVAEAKRLADELEAKQAEEAAEAVTEQEANEVTANDMAPKRNKLGRSSRLTKNSSKPLLLSSPTKTPSLQLGSTPVGGDALSLTPKTPKTPLDSWRKGATSVGKEVLAIKAMKKQYRIPTDDLYPEPELVANWFSLDTNHNPPVYRLKPVSSHFPDIVGRDAQKRKEARVHWQTTTRRLLTQLHFYARLAGLSKGQLEKYSLSSVERELRLGILDQLSDTRSTCLWVRRAIQDISLSDTKARDYVNVDKSGSHLDQAAADRLEGMKHELENALDQSCIQAVAVYWGQQGIAPAVSIYYASYIEGLCQDV